MQQNVTVTARVRRLRERLEREFSRMPHGHKLVCPEEQRSFAELACEAYSASVGEPEVLRRAEFLTLFAERVSVVIREDERIVGSQRFVQPPWHDMVAPERLAQCGVHPNHGHIIVDYGRVITRGIPGLQRQVSTMGDGSNRRAFVQTLEALATFVRRHGCGELAERAPRSFHEALQMVWFTQVFLRAEGNASAVSFGRFDQYLWPFLQRDLDSGRVDPDDAFELLCCFFMKCCEGGESQNLTVGGNSEENPLSLLVLSAMRELKVWQPSISVRIGTGTTEAFWRESLLLCDTGIGMPSFFNDPVVSQALRKLDLPPERAADWGIVGCYEASPQGDAYPLTVSFNRDELRGESGLALLRQVVETYFAKGGFHLHVNIVDAAELRKAKAQPERYDDLTVRISGFSARFVALGEAWQDAIIERTAKGM